MSRNGPRQLEFLRDLPPDAARFLDADSQARLKEVRRLAPEPKATHTLIGIGGLGSATTLSSTEIGFAKTELASGQAVVLETRNSIKPISIEELQGEIDKEPISSLPELWGKKVRLPFDALTGRIGSIFPNEMVCVLYGEGERDFTVLPLKDLQLHNPELLENYPFKI